MRLSGIKLAGFKSFVDSAYLPLPSNLSSVVGPNGCGKSNIIDAVRWVLGETSMRTLRSESMEDVIFNGSKARKPVGKASVELLFDNSDGTIAGPYAAYNEISVRRELTRDGNSQYLLNGRKCKKRDVTDLFLGTGLGLKSGYAIIEQGMVSRMVEAKPDELRHWLEEAAGISRYKERRRETESRIRQTRENLDRLNDLRAELQARLNALQRQARNAEKYKEYKASERRLRGELLVLRWRELSRECAAHEAQIQAYDAQLKAEREKVTAAQSAQESAERENRDANHRLSEEQTRVYEAEAALARHEQSLKHARELRNLKRQELAQLQQQLDALDASEKAGRDRLAALQREIGEQEQAQQAAAGEHEQAQSQLREQEDALHGAEKAWEAFTERAESPLVQTEGERVHVRELERALQQVESRLAQLRDERASLEPEPLQQSLGETDRELTQLKQELELMQKRIDELDASLQRLRDERAASDSSLHEARQAQQSARGKVASLETLQQAALREDDDELRGWLSARDLGEAPRLAAVIRVDAGWEPAVEHVLGGLLQAPLSDSLDAVLNAGGETPESGACVIDGGIDGSSASFGTLAARVQGPRAVRAWLQGVRTVEDLEQAQAQRAGLGPEESLITPDGTWIGRDWLRFPRRGDSASGVIARGMMLRQLKAEAERQEQLVREREQQLDATRKRLQQAEQERGELGGRFDQRRHVQAQKLAQRQAQAVRLEQTQKRVAEVDEALVSLETAHREQGAELSAARERLVQLERTAEQLRGERSEVQQRLSAAREGLQQARGRVAQVAERLNQLQVRLAGTRSQQQAMSQSLDEMVQRREQLGVRIEEHSAAARELDAPVEDEARELDRLRAGVEQSRQGLKQARDAVTLAENRLGNALQGLRQVEASRDAAGERLQQARLGFEGLSTRRQGLEEQIGEAGFQRDELLERLDDEANAQAWDEQIEALTRRIDRLGPINLAAIQELEEAREREEYLGKQYDDLTGALDTLEEAILKIDRETRDRFRVTFEQVNETFKMRFPRLFGGGEAYLELTGDDLLDTGVRVMARPPGKRNSSIQLLSGGEKAMVAVALLLALFELTPAPFCMLDEVDAPLDDANVSRFVETIRDMSATVQFIIITHNKITMELAEQLHGVTMAEPGVSRLVSVDVKQALELAEEAA